MRIYLDNCCYNRPYDDLSQLTVSLEAQAKLFIQTRSKTANMILQLPKYFVMRWQTARPRSGERS